MTLLGWRSHLSDPSRRKPFFGGVGWLVGWLFRCLVVWFVGLLLVRRLVGWVGLLVACLVRWLGGWLRGWVGGLVGLVVGWMVDWVAGCVVGWLFRWFEGSVFVFMFCGLIWLLWVFECFECVVYVAFWFFVLLLLGVRSGLLSTNNKWAKNVMITSWDPWRETNIVLWFQDLLQKKWHLIFGRAAHGQLGSVWMFVFRCTVRILWFLAAWIWSRPGRFSHTSFLEIHH